MPALSHEVPVVVNGAPVSPAALARTWIYSRPVVLWACSLDQKQHHLGTCQKYKSLSSPTVCFHKLCRRLSHWCALPAAMSSVSKACVFCLLRTLCPLPTPAAAAHLRSLLLLTLITAIVAALVPSLLFWLPSEPSWLGVAERCA